MKNTLRKVLLNTYLSLFIFCMINREFLLFGIDLRFVMVPLGVWLIGIYIVANKGKICIKLNENYKQFNYLILFYSWILISNISWIWNGLPMNQTKFINEIILILNIFISIIVIRLYENEISSLYIKKNIIFSCLILVISMILVVMGFTAEQISASKDAPIMYETGGGVTHTNLFGWNFRPSGYASDPNYATLLMIIACACVKNLNTTKIKKIIYMTPFFLGIALAFSKTTLIATFFSMIYIVFLRGIVKNKKTSIFLSKILLIIVIIVSVSAPFVSELGNILPQTMTTRLIMWKSAMNLFCKSPLIGSGIVSARSFFSIKNWFVQTHNTYLQVLSETGLIGMILFYLLMVNTLKRNYNNTTNFFITIAFFIFMVDFETIAMQFFTYVVLLCQVGSEEGKDDKQ